MSHNPRHVRRAARRPQVWGLMNSPEFLWSGEEREEAAKGGLLEKYFSSSCNFASTGSDTVGGISVAAALRELTA